MESINIKLIWIKKIITILYSKVNFLISQPKPVVGTQKNRLNERVLLSSKNK